MRLLKRIKSKSIPDGLASRTDIWITEIAGENILLIEQRFLTKNKPSSGQTLLYTKCGYNINVNCIAMRSSTAFEVMKTLNQLFNIKSNQI